MAYGNKTFKHKSIASSSAKTIAKKALKGVKALKAEKEKKYFDVDQAGQEIVTTGTVQSVSNVPQGDTSITRDGDQIQLKSIQARLTWYMPQVLGAGVPVVVGRVILFVDEQPNNTIPVTTDVLVTAGPNSPLNLNNRLRFRILKDKVFDMASGIATAQAINNPKSTKQMKMYKRINRKCVFNGAGTDIAQTNNVYMLFISSATTTNAPFCAFYSRLRFTDS